MVLTRKYNLVNNLTGWGVFVIALLTYWLTLEPTASYWDCGEFIIQADKLEIGHPPGNPIFMLTARFFSNFAFGDPSMVALMVNAMSGLLSAFTILLLFWTVTHLVRRLVVRDGTSELSLPQYLTVMGSGLCGALAYAWSDTFWFSAVEGEVYAFSSFCTALVFWLILKWENRADEPHSDRYLILIAYIIGVSIAVHLLNLLCIPAIVLVYCYRKFSEMNVKKSLLALAVSFAIIVLVLYGLVPGFIEVAGYFELFCVNTLGLPFNSGTLIYTLLTVGVFVWALYELYVQKSPQRIRISFALAVLISGMLLIGSGLLIGLILFVALCYFLFARWKRNLPLRWLNVAMWSIAVIFVGYSSYGLILIRSNARTPMNQNAPDNVFSLASYLNREQYGQTPLLYGQTYESQPMQQMDADGMPTTYVEKGKAQYAKGVKGATVNSLNGFLTPDEVAKDNSLAKRGKDYYALYDYTSEYVMNPELNLFLPRIHSSVPAHAAGYELWVPGLKEGSDVVEISALDVAGNEVPLPSYEPAYNEMGEAYYPPTTARRPTFGQNMEYFFNYQLNHMYWRYFLWNFAGRQNDINNQYGEKDAGNWISGIPFIDNPRLGDQSMLPPEYGVENKGHNVFYMLPLLLGILGLLWQAFRGKRGIEQFWVVFFLFFMTGIAIVLYLNQPPMQPRERDYAYAGSFYAFAIWIGMGVAAIRQIVLWFADRQTNKNKPEQSSDAVSDGQAAGKHGMMAAVVAVAVGLIVPLQMVSQTWDDHDRSGRYAARDYAINYLNSLEPNAIIFCNGDNDTFPLWYAQEVEGVRPDVKIINLSYLGSDWYANQQRVPTYKAAPVKFTAKPSDYAYDRRNVVYLTQETDMMNAVPLLDALREIYSDKAVDKKHSVPKIMHSSTYIPVDSAVVAKRGLVPAGQAVLENIPVNLKSMSLGELLMLDIIATNAANGWERPIYWAMTVGEENFSAFLPYVRQVGMALQLVPYNASTATDTALAYPVIMNKYLWGGADNYENPPYFDETASRMLSSTRMTVLDLARSLAIEHQYEKAAKVLDLFRKKLAGPQHFLNFSDVYALGSIYCTIGDESGNKQYTDTGLKILSDAIVRYAANVRYADYLAEVWGVSERYDPSSGTIAVVPNVYTTPENAAILYSYYTLVDTYEHCAAMLYGEKKASEMTQSVLKKAGISSGMAKRLKDYSVKSQTPQANPNGGGMDGYVEELARYAEIVVEMQGKSAEEYAAASELERQVDSTFVLLLQEYIANGGSQEELLKYEVFDKVDGERSMKMGEAFIAAHPE